MKILVDSHSTVTQSKSGGLQVRIFEHLNSLKRESITCKLFNKWEDKIEDYDILHLFKVTKDSYNEVLYAKQKGRKVVISAVIPIDSGRNINISLLLASVLKLSLPHEFIRKALEIADIVTAETRMEKKFIVDYYKIKPEKIVVIPNGVSRRFTNDNPLNISFKEHFNIKEPFVLQVGRIDSNKNQLRVIKALKDLKIPVVFIGGAYLNEQKYFDECKKELGTNMLMTGWIDHSSDLILSAYREAKVLVLPSLYETFGNVLIEAGVSGANIACSETLPINEFSISKFWSTFNPLNINTIKECILKEYYRENDKSAIKDEFLSTFSWDNIIKEYIDIYTDLCKN